MTRLVIGMILLAASAPSETRAMNMPDNDLDSLVYLADEIVEGQIVRSQVQWDEPPPDIKVMAVLHGSLQVDQHISVPTVAFMKGHEAFGNFVPDALEVDDSLILFLKKAPRKFQHENVPTIYYPTGSGLKRVIDGKVYNFHEDIFRGRYMSEGESSPFWTFHQSADELRDAIKASLVQVAAWRAEFAVPAVKADIPRLLSLLESRSKVRERSYCNDDLIADIVSERLAAFHDVQSLYKALAINSGNPGVLGAGFGTPEGRDFLLQKVADPQEPLEQRVALANVIDDAGSIYRSTLTDIRPHKSDTVGDADKNNSFYLTRIATLIASGKLDDAVIERLLDSLNPLIWHAAQDKEGRADLAAARSLLQKMGADVSLPSRFTQQVHDVIRCIDGNMK